MLRNRSIQTQVVFIIVVALLFLAAVLQLVQSLHQRDALIEAHRDQSLAIAGSLRESLKAFDQVLTSLPTSEDGEFPLTAAQIMPMMVEMFEQGFADFVAENPGVAFEAISLSNGTVIIHSDPDQRGRRLQELNLAALPLDETVRRDVPGYDPVYLTRVHIDASDYFAGIKMDFIIGMYAAPIDEELRDSLAYSGVVALIAVGFVSVIAVFFVRRRLVKPLQEVGAIAQHFSRGELSHRIEPRGSAELRSLAKILNQMAVNLEQSREVVEAMLHNMEQRVQLHDRDLEIAVEIGRIAARLRDVDALLQETVDQIRARFETIYHAQVFLLDDQGEYAVLVKSTGEAGQRLLQLGHRLAVGSDSVIGRVTERGEIVMASDTRTGEVPWQPNPILPDTRAEMALPLVIEDRVIGALDVQSTSPDVFTTEMIQVFSVLAAQIAIAIRNARLLAEAEQRIREINELNRRLTRSTWQEYVGLERAGGAQGYLYDQMQTIPLEQGDEARLPARRVEAEIQVRGQAIGTLMAAKPDGSELTEDDQLLLQAVADRVALAVESARLFEQTQRALAETERLYETARSVSSATDLAEIYELVAEQLGMATSSVERIEVLLSGPAPTLVQYLESAFVWGRGAPVPSDGAARRIEVLLPSHAAGEMLPTDTPLMLADVAHELPEDHPLFSHLSELGARSAVIAPLTAGGQWFGMIVCSSPRAHAFQPSYVTFVSALADQLAIAIENRRLFEDAQAEARRARALAEAGQLASQIGGDFVTGLQNLFQAVAGPGDYDRWWFGLVSEDGAAMTQVAASATLDVLSVQVETDQHALAEAARIGEIVLVNDPADHPVADGQDPAQTHLWGKHIAMPVKIGEALVGVLLIGRPLDGHNLDERDIQLAATLASQVAVATQNQQLFAEAESQGQRLQTIVDTMPTGILVMDAQGTVVLSNQNLRDLLGPEMRPGTEERPQPYPIVRTGTGEPYPREEWPLSRVFRTGSPAVVDDMTVLHPSGHEISVLAQAAPIRDAAGNITAVVSALQDITELQELERALQDSLRETTLLYEASRSISRAGSMAELMEVTLHQINTLFPDQVYVFLREYDEVGGVSIRLVASQPTRPPEDCDLAQFEPLLVDKPVIINASDAPAELEACLEKMGLGTVGSFPLSVHQQINGWILIGFTDTDHLAVEERRFMTTLADQAAVTIENQRLLDRTEAVLRDTAVLYQASRAIADAQNPEDLLEALVEHASTGPVQYAALYLLQGDVEDTELTTIELAASWADQSAADPAGTRYQPHRFAFWDYLVAEDITHLDDVDEYPDLNLDMRYLFTLLEIRAAVIIPLRVAERVIGVVVLGFPDPRPHTDSQLRIYRSVADQMAVALENARLYRQAQRRARQIRTSAEIGRAVTSILQLDELLPQIVNLLLEAFEYDHAQVFLISEDGTQADLVASTGEAGRQLLAVQHNLPVGSQSVIGQVTATGQPQIALDTAEALVVHKPNPYLPETRSEMALPLVARGEILGALDLQSNRPGAFTPEDIQALTPLADMVAIAINNARLFEVSQQRAEEMAFLFTVTTAATTSPDLTESLEQAVETLRALLNVSSASIFLPDESGQFMVRGANVGVTGVDTRHSAIALDRGLIGWVARHLEAVIIGDVAQDPRRLATSSNTQSVIAVPLQTAGSLVGVLVAESEKLNAFDENDLRLLQALSSSLAAIIQNQRLLQEVQAANERLLEVDRLKTNFLAAMSHELRTPLNSIIGFSRVILKGIDGPLTETQEQDLTTIYESGRHLLGLVNDILDQAKIEAGKMELTFGYFKLQDVVKSVMSSAIGLTREKPIDLRTEIADDLPNVYGDEFRTRQILLNLVANAAKFTDKGSITVSVYPVTEDGIQYVQISVADTGIGIAEEDMPLLFEAFQQVDNTLTRSHEGTGMGLPLAKSLTELQHGRIWVESEPGVGSTFSFTVPVAPVDGEKGQADEADAPRKVTGTLHPPEPAGNPVPSAQVALVIEGNLEIISLYRHYLARIGYDVVGTAQVGQALEMVIAYRPSLVVLDVDIGDGAGWQLLEQLTTLVDTADIPVVVATMNGDTERTRQLGAAGHLLKPFSEEQLVAVVRQAEEAAGYQRILLVDDKPETVRLFRETLEASGEYYVVQATTGQEALAILQQPQAVDLVILDLRMPEVDGFEVLQALRSDERTAHIPVLVLTAEDVSDEERAVLQAVDVYRKDSLDEQGFLQTVETQLGGTQENE